MGEFNWVVFKVSLAIVTLGAAVMFIGGCAPARHPSLWCQMGMSGTGATVLLCRPIVSEQVIPAPAQQSQPDLKEGA
jgi:hypothetical protein